MPFRAGFARNHSPRNILTLRDETARRKSRVPAVQLTAVLFYATRTGVPCLINVFQYPRDRGRPRRAAEKEGGRGKKRPGSARGPRRGRLEESQLISEYHRRILESPCLSYPPLHPAAAVTPGPF